MSEVGNPLAVRTPEESFLGLLKKQFTKAHSMQPANLVDSTYYVSMTEVDDRAAEVVAIDTHDPSGEYRRIDLLKILPGDEPLIFFVETDDAYLFTTPEFLIVRKSDPDTNLNLFTANREIVLPLDINRDISSKDRAVGIGQLALEVINGDIVTPPDYTVSLETF